MATLDAANPTGSSPWAPFRHGLFSTIWLATVVSSIGGWMYSAASAWLMTTLQPDPVIVGLVQTAATLPMFLLAIPAGALTDIIDKRHFLLFGEVGITITGTIFAVVVWADIVTPLNLLIFTFVSNAAVALTAPAWQAVVPQLVPKPDLGAAIAANSMGINVSRAIGPAMGGVLAASLGRSAPFWVNAFSNLGVIAVLLTWHPRKEGQSALPMERLGSAIRTGLRHARYNPPLRATFVRAIAFFLFGSTYWALLPLVTHSQLRGGGSLYGALLGVIGGSAVLGALVMPWLQQRCGRDGVVVAASFTTALALVLFGIASDWPLAVVASVLAGTSWIAAVAGLNVSAQAALPDWVRGRGIAIYMSVFFGALALGNLLWGAVANLVGLPTAHFVAATCLLVSIRMTSRWKLGGGVPSDLTPSMHWPAPVLQRHLIESGGRVLVTIEYQVPAANRTPFLAAIEKLGEQRRQDGAYAWGVFEDVAGDGRFVETFLVESWLEYLRQHERATKRLRFLDDAVRGLTTGDQPVVTHLIAAEPDREFPSRHKRASRRLPSRRERFVSDLATPEGKPVKE